MKPRIVGMHIEGHDVVLRVRVGLEIDGEPFGLDSPRLTEILREALTPIIGKALAKDGRTLPKEG